MSKSKLKKLAQKHFGATSEYERVWISTQVLPLLQEVERIAKEEERKKNKKYCDAVYKAYNAGFNVNCMFCGFKDKALGEALTPPLKDPN